MAYDSPAASIPDVHGATAAQAENEGAVQHDMFVRNMAQRMGNPSLQALRAQNPFVPIVAFPNSSLTLTLAGTGAPVDIPIPEGTKLIYISGSDEYYISRNGNAQVPNVAARTQFDTTDFTGSFQNPNGVWLYVEEIRSFSIVSKNANTRVSICAWQQL